MNPFGWLIWVLLALVLSPLIAWFVLSPGWAFLYTLIIVGGTGAFVAWVLSNTRFT